MNNMVGSLRVLAGEEAQSDSEARTSISAYGMDAMAAGETNKRAMLRLAAVGDCNTCGIIVPAIGNTILDKVASGLELAGYSSTLQYLGYGMATSREGVERVSRDATAADVAIINFGLVDTWITSIPGIYIPYYPENWFRKRCRKLLKFVKRRLRGSWVRRIVPSGVVVPMREYHCNMRKMIQGLRALNPEALIVLWGTAPVRNNDVRNDNIRRYNTLLAAIAKDDHCIYIDTEATLSSIAPEERYLDDVHLTEAATDAVGKVIAREIAYRLRDRKSAAA